MNTKIPALIPAIFTTLSVCFAGSGITSGSSVAAAKWTKKKNKLLKTANYHRKETAQLLQKGDLFHLLEWK